jgi:hypothetical protein
MLAPVTHILPLTLIRRERLLPVPGKVIARKGQKVAATDVVAEANLHPNHLLLNIAKGLKLAPAKADAALTCQAGETVSEGDIIAGPVGFPARVIRAPGAGKILLAGKGQVLLELQTPPYELKASLPGLVVDLIPERGVVVETSGALIQGVWGNGKLDYGLLSIALKEPDEVLAADTLNVSQRGFVVLAGHVDSAEILKTASELPLRGLILSSMDPELLLLAASLSIPVILLDGFGRRPMNPAAYQLLTTNDRREVAVNAEIWDRYTGVRPEIVIPLPASGSLPLPTGVTEFAPGQTVRIVSGPLRSKVGRIEELLDRVTLPSGLRAACARIHLGEGEPAVVPLSNIEVIQ